MFGNMAFKKPPKLIITGKFWTSDWKEQGDIDNLEKRLCGFCQLNDKADSIVESIRQCLYRAFDYESLDQQTNKVIFNVSGL